jgi:LysR family glycine cleavage system transcriptional activator
MLSDRRRLPPINAIRVFEAAARLQSFTRAGEELGMTQAAVSYQIKLLEERLGFRLFVRAPRQVTLTPNGRRLSASASEAFRVLEAAFASTSQDAESVLSITTFSTFSANWLVPRLGAFQVAHPQLAVRVDTSSTLVDLTKEDFDIGIRLGDGRWPGVEAHFLFEEPATALVPTAALATLGPDPEPRDLLKLRLIGPIDWWVRWFEVAGVPASTLPARTPLVLETQYMEVGAALAAGNAAAIVWPRYFAREIVAGLLVRPFAAELPGDSVWAAYDRSRRASPKIRAFIGWLKAEVEREAGAGASRGRRKS